MTKLPAEVDLQPPRELYLGQVHPGVFETRVIADVSVCPTTQIDTFTCAEGQEA